MFQRILLALDSSAAREQTVQTVASLAAPWGSTVHVLHVEAAAPAGPDAVALEEESAARKVLEEALRVLRDAGVRADGELLRSFTTQIPALISGVAERRGADLLVLGTHPRGLFAALLNPRVSDAVSHAARIPVLLVPETGRA